MKKVTVKYCKIENILVDVTLETNVTIRRKTHDKRSKINSIKRGK